MRGRGFTLIELLAVIVILSIIAIIATPVVLNIIEDARINSYKRSIDLYGKAVEQALARYQITNVGKVQGELLQSNEGKILTEKANNSISLNVDYDGSKVECKNIYVSDKDKVYIYNCKVNGRTINYSYGFDKNIVKISEAKEDMPAKYAIKVNSEDVFNFYVLSTEGNNINLIMDKNICEDGTTNYTQSNNYCRYAWYDDGDNITSNDTNEYGPVTAMQALYNATKNWNNVHAMSFSYEDEGRKYAEDNNISKYGYGEILTTEFGIKITKKDKKTEVTGEENRIPVITYEYGTTLKARLPKYSEVYNTNTLDTTHCHSAAGSCPAWLTNGLKEHQQYYLENEHISEIEGYWTLSSSYGESTRARDVGWEGRGNYSTVTSYKDNIGIRAVITVPKSSLS